MTRISAFPQVLIVEDQTEVAQMLTDLLRQAGYDAAAATTGDDALALAAAHRPGFVLLDLTPGRDGIQVLRELHALDPELPVIILTGAGSPDQAREAMKNGAADFFTKPFDNQELLASIADAMANRPALRARLERPADTRATNLAVKRAYTFK